MSVRWIRTPLLGLADATLPLTCAACGQWIPAEAPSLCAPCAAQLDQAIHTPYCPRCGRSAQPVTLDTHGCARCRREDVWNFAAVVRVGAYSCEPLRRLLLDVKFGGNERSAACLARILARAMDSQPWLAEVDALVPVPMHRLRRWQRPCAHARLLAEHLLRELHRRGLSRLRLRAADVRRVRYAESQMGLSSRQRRFDNVRGCFAAANNGRLRGRTVCIVDNLMTSGATLIELCKALRRAGARRIYAAIGARASVAGEPQPGPAADIDDGVEDGAD